MIARQVQGNEERGMISSKTCYQTNEAPLQRPHFFNNFYGTFPENNFMESYHPINIGGLEQTFTISHLHFFYQPFLPFTLFFF